ncbi:MAG: PAS domain S-box protein, partial [Cyclobacteriaceae bacterium]|nr:PAS domain S-box protein [Cyclobacteriaceae bacterium]
EGALQNLGYRMDEMLNMVTVDIKPDFDILKFKELIQPLKDKKTQKLEYRTLHKRKNGSLYPVEVHLQVVETGIYSKFVAVALDITEKEKIEKQKRESEEMASNIANSIPGLVMKYELYNNNNKDNISFVSQGMQEIWGISTNDALGNSKLFWEKIHPEDIDEIQLALSASAKKMTLFQHEFRVKNKELTKWVYLRGAPKNESKEKTSWYMVALDITPLKSIQEELKRTKSLLDHAGNLTKVGGWEMDIETNQIKWSEETRKIFDVSPEKTLTLESTLKFFRDRKTRVKLVKKIQETLLYKDEFNEDFEILTAKGNKKWIRLIGKPEPDLGGDTIFHGAVIDITENKQRDEELKLQEKVIKSSKDSVVITKGSGLNGQIIFVNKSFSKMTGYTMDEIAGKTPNILYGAATDQLELNEIEESILKGKSHESELLFYKKSGDHFWVNQYIAPLFLENGEISNFIYIQQDIDEKKKKEIERDRIINDLEKLNKEMDNFIYRVSHDLRAPISSALGLINISQKENDIDNIKTYLDIQKNSLNKLDNFIQDILNYSRNTRLKVQANKIEVQELINEITHQLEYSAEAQNIIKTKVKHEYIYYGDELRLSIILTNLISNALKFTKNLNRPPEIIISAKINKKELYLTIEDNGIGIEQKYLNQIYDMFFRATDTNHGSGLGLYIVKDAVNLLKGNIEVESRFMKGTKFTLRIPNGI